MNATIHKRLQKPKADPLFPLPGRRRRRRGRYKILRCELEVLDSVGKKKTQGAVVSSTDDLQRIVRNAQSVQGCEQILVVREKAVKGADDDVNRQTSNVRRIIVGESENGVLVPKGRVVVEHGGHQLGFINHHV